MVQNCPFACYHQSQNSWLRTRPIFGWRSRCPIDLVRQTSSKTLRSGQQAGPMIGTCKHFKRKIGTVGLSGKQVKPTFRRSHRVNAHTLSVPFWACGTW